MQVFCHPMRTVAPWATLLLLCGIMAAMFAGCSHSPDTSASPPASAAPGTPGGNGTPPAGAARRVADQAKQDTTP